MGVLFRRRKADRDHVTNSLIRRGVYRIPDIYDDEEGKSLKDQKVAYSFWSAVKYTTILSFLLWWLPIFGQMIAGYVGGRRAGTPWKGALAALIPVIIIFAFLGGIEMGWIPTKFFGIDFAPAAIMGAIGAYVPLIEPYINFTMMYLDSFLEAIQATTSLRLDSYIITVAFAYIGGILSDQTRREMEYISRHGGPKTTVVVEGNASPREVVSHTPSWSTQFFQPRRAPSEPMSFEELTPVGAVPYLASTGSRPTRQVAREEDMEEIGPEERRRIKGRAKTMAKNQREVEKKVRAKSRKRGAEQESSLLKRALGTKPERSKGRRRSRKAPEEEQMQGGGDWEFM